MFVFESFRLACLHILRTLLSVAWLSLPISSKPAMRMSSAMLNTFDSPWNSSSIFLWNISPASTTPNGSCTYLYLPKGQEKAIKCDDCSTSFKLWDPKLTLMSMRYLTPANLGSMSLKIGPLWIGLIRTLFNWARSKHNLTLPCAFGTTVKLLHHSDVSSISRSTIICYFCSLSSSSYSGS